MSATKSSSGSRRQEPAFGLVAYFGARANQEAVKPRLLDLFCGAGGAAMGYSRAGFEVVGVDIAPQPHYPFVFVQQDALLYLETPRLDYHFDAIHASPPCQAFTIAQNARKRAHEHPDLLTPTRTLLEATGLPWVIENVPGAPMRRDIILCGASFGLRHDGFELRRHRHFETNWPAMSMPCACGELPAAPVFGHNAGRDFYRRYGRGYNADARREVMGIDWMTRDEISEAIPPCFTEFVGAQLLDHLRHLAAA